MDNVHESSDVDHLDSSDFIAQSNTQRLNEPAGLRRGYGGLARMRQSFTMTDVPMQNDTAPGAPYAPFVEGGLAYVDAAFQWGAPQASLPS
jgi:hypothetical protein